jgi:hypothetical protein
MMLGRDLEKAPRRKNVDIPVGNIWHRVRMRSPGVGKKTC